MEIKEKTQNLSIKELENFARLQIEKLNKKYGLEKDRDKDNWAYALKIGEELGELYQELLSHKGYQREEKMQNFKKDDIKKEIVDVIFTVFILGKSLDIDINEAIIERMGEIIKR